MGAFIALPFMVIDLTYGFDGASFAMMVKVRFDCSGVGGSLIVILLKNGL